MSEPGERVVRGHDVSPGDVVMIKLMLEDRTTGRPYAWRRFACVQIVGLRHIVTINLKAELDPSRDVREIDLKHGQEEVYKLPEERWPQGVVAMRMKYIAKGLIKL